MTLAELNERLLAWATAAPRQARLLRARADHFGRRGEPHEEDGSFELRMNAMLEFYLFDWREPSDGPTTLALFLEEVGETLPPEEAEAFRALAGNRHALVEVRKVEPGTIRVRDVFRGDDLEVTERRQVAGLARGDLLEARLMPLDGHLVFSGAFLWQPREARKAILAEVKKLRRAAGKDGAPEVEPFLAVLSRMAFKVERYRNVRLESIYDFTVDQRSLTPRPGPR